MKKTLLIAALTAASYMALAQKLPEPEWMHKKFSSKGFRFMFVTASGEGDTREEAHEVAFANAYVGGLRENGLTVVAEQTIADIKRQGLNAYIKGTNGYPVRIYCEERLQLDDNRFIAYMLVQMAKSANQAPSFDDAEELGDICKRKTFEALAEKYYKERDKRKQAESKKEAKNQRNKERLDRKMAKPFWQNKYHSFLSFGIDNGFTTGTMLGGYFMGRHGGMVGFGYQAAVSVGLSENMSAENREMNYSLGLKFYPYKTAYLGVYGTLLNKAKPFYNDYSGKFGLKGTLSSANVSYMVGNDFCFGRSYGAGAGVVFSIAAGVLNPVWEEWQDGLSKWTFAWHVGFGIIF